MHDLGKIGILYVNSLDLGKHLDEDAQWRIGLAAAVPSQQTSYHAIEHQHG